jgi:predicted porin
MKKSLFAIAAVTAFAGAAQAQSSVTVYGIMDVGFVGGNERLAGVPSTNTTFRGQSVVKQNMSGIGASAQSTSRLGLRGTEDLGGGTSAFFNVEIALAPNTAAVFGSTRTAVVGLAQKGYGRFAVGTQNTVIADAMGPTITGQFNNIAGSLMFPGVTGTTGSGTSNSNFTDGLLNRSSANGNTDAFTFRTTNTLKLQTERFAGFTGSVMIMANDQTDTQGNPAANTTGYTGGKNNQNGWGLGASYLYKKFQLTAAYQSFDATNPYGLASTTANASAPNTTTGVITPQQTAGVTRTAGAEAAFGAVATGQNVKDNQAYVGATYDFGILKVYGSWINRKVTSQIVPTQFASRTAQEIGVRGNWTPKIESWASAANGRLEAFGNSGPTANIVGWQLGTNYIMSKRTNLYAIYGQSGTSNVSFANSNPTSYNINNYAVGVRHTF